MGRMVRYAAVLLRDASNSHTALELSDRSTSETVLILSSLVEASATGALHRSLGVVPDAVRLFRDIVLCPMPIDPATRSAALGRVADARLTPAARTEFAISIITATRSASRVDDRLIPMLDETALPSLRALVRPGDRYESFHFGAAAALSQYGDTSIDTALSGSRAALSAQAFDGFVQVCRWRVRIQQSQEILLAEIASGADVRVEDRVWAVRRAVERGLPRERIRSAVLDFASRVPPKTVTSRDGRRVTFFPSLSELKAAAIGFGVLGSDDLPDVPLMHAPVP